MHTKKRLLTLAAALFISLTACEGLPTEPTLGLETGAVAQSLHGPTTVTIDFDDVPPPTGGDDVTLLATHSEDGFRLNHSGGGFSSPGTDNPIYVGSKTLFPFPDGGVTTLTKDGGGAFDVLSIDLAEVPFIGLGPVDVTFTGTKAGSPSVSQTFTTDGIFGLDEPITFPASFTDLVSLSWTQGGYPDFRLHQFDDIVLSFVSISPVDPTTRDECKNGGFADFDFRNQGECVQFVETGKDRR